MNDNLKKRKKILLTGGHLSPLLAVYEELKGKAEVSIIGRKYAFEKDHTDSLEYELFKNEDVHLHDLRAPRLQRKYTKNTIPSFFKSPQAILSAYKILKQESPDVVVVFGGYVGLPVALAAYIKKTPIILHEQTLHAGLTNKIIGKFATRVCISFPSSEKYFNRKKTVLTGNPVRKEVFEVQKGFRLLRSKPLLYITGGSTGAHPINTIISEILETLLLEFNIIHQTGGAKEFLDYEKLTALKQKLEKNFSENYLLRKYILPDEIGWIYKHADVILSRAGINTVTELIMLSKKALLIPLPHGQKNEQLENAKMYKETGLGEYILQDAVTKDKTIKMLLDLLGKNVKKTEVKDASSAQKIADIVLNA